MTTGARPRDNVFGDALLAARRRAGLTQQRVAEELGVGRAMVSQWETGRHLPSLPYVEHLGRVLGAADELSAAARGRTQGVVAVPSPRDPEAPVGPTLYDVHRGLGRVLVDALVLDDDGAPLGWRRDFRPDRIPSAFTTASAMRLLTALQDPPYVDRHALGLRLLEFRAKKGGWGTQAIGRRPEATAVVIDALERIGATFDIDEALAELDDLLVGQDRVHTYVLVEALSTTARLRPTSGLTQRLASELLQNRDAANPAWPEKQPTVAGAVPRPSTAHTARAVTVLAHALERGLDDPRGEYRAAVGAGQAWLEENSNLAPVRENVEPEGQRDLEIRHFTPALVAHAVASGDMPSWDLLSRALREVWRAYNPAIRRWQWSNGDVPVWLQLDALRAVTAAHARQTAVPVEAVG